MGQALLAYERISGRDGKAICIKTLTPLPGRQFIDTNSKGVHQHQCVTYNREIFNTLSVVINKQKMGRLEKQIKIRAFLYISSKLTQFKGHTLADASTHVTIRRSACSAGRRLKPNCHLRARGAGGGLFLPVLRSVSNKVLDDPVHGSPVPGEHRSGQGRPGGMHACSNTTATSISHRRPDSRSVPTPRPGRKHSLCDGQFNSWLGKSCKNAAVFPSFLPQLPHKATLHNNLNPEFTCEARLHSPAVFGER